MQMHSHSIIQKMRCENNEYKPRICGLRKESMKNKIEEILKPFEPIAVKRNYEIKMEFKELD